MGDFVSLSPAGLRLLAFAAHPETVRYETVREFAALEGLDGWAATALVGHALAVDDSPWAAAFEAALSAAVRRVVFAPLLELGQAIGQMVRQVGEVLAPFARLVQESGVGGMVPAPPVVGCGCLCGTHRATGYGVCRGELPEAELVGFTFPGPPRTTMRRTVRVCGPCAAAQTARLGVGG